MKTTFVREPYTKPLYFGLFDCTFYHDGLLSAHAIKCAEGTEEGLETLYRHWVKNWDYGSFTIFQVDSLDPRTCEAVYLVNGSEATPYPHQGAPEDYGFTSSPGWFRLAMNGSSGDMSALGARFREEDAEQDAAETKAYFEGLQHA